MLRSLYKQFHAGERSRAKRILLSLNETSLLSGEVIATKLLEPYIKRNAEGDGQGIIVIPGFLGSDRYNTMLLNFLNEVGYNASGWMQGRNTGPKDGVLDNLLREVDFKYQQTGRKVTLIGHSLGGIYAREVARTDPSKIERIITLGSPFGRRQSDRTLVSKLYWTLNQDAETSVDRQQLRVAPDVPITSVYTRGDSVIKWQSSVQLRGHKRTENVEVYGTHCGLSLNYAVWHLILDRMQTDSQFWQKFDNTGWKQTVFPVSELAT